MQTLGDGYFDVPTGKLAAVVTSLQMLARPEPLPEPVPPDPALMLHHLARPDCERYLALFRSIGEPWLWVSRLKLSRTKLESILHDPSVEVHVATRGERDVGLLELDFREAGACELSFFGLVSDEVGTGAGRWLMANAVRRAWSRPIAKFWVHTCSLDHPRAVDFYIRSGFTPYRRQVEVFDDPRCTQLLPASAAPQVPLIRP